MIDPSSIAQMPRLAPHKRTVPRETPQQAGGFERLLGTTIECEPVAPRDGNAVEVLFDDRNGTGQSIILPWRLFANDALSQLLNPAAGTANAAGIVRPATQSLSAAASAAGTSAMEPTYPTAVEAGVADAMASPLANAAPAQVASGSRGSASAAPATAPSLAEPWQTRLLRWLENADGGLVARLRDYRLDADAQARCVEQLLNFAREHGLNLQRVVVNAREVWRAPR
ncbi:MAG TPA: hypothetical protein VGD42_01900 [Lysobacter sp.]